VVVSERTGRWSLRAWVLMFALAHRATAPFPGAKTGRGPSLSAPQGTASGGGDDPTLTPLSIHSHTPESRAWPCPLPLHPVPRLPTTTMCPQHDGLPSAPTDPFEPSAMAPAHQQHKEPRLDAGNKHQDHCACAKFAVLSPPESTR
jgi:hypothetical protein